MSIVTILFLGNKFSRHFFEFLPAPFSCQSWTPPFRFPLPLFDHTLFYFSSNLTFFGDFWKRPIRFLLFQVFLTLLIFQFEAQWLRYTLILKFPTFVAFQFRLKKKEIIFFICKIRIELFFALLNKTLSPMS